MHKFVVIAGVRVTGIHLYDECVARKIPCHGHATDLYIPVTEETTALLAHFGLTATVFANQVEGGRWYDVPFEYLPGWMAKLVRHGKS